MLVAVPALSVDMAADDYKFRDYFLSAQKEHLSWYQTRNPPWYLTGVMADGDAETTKFLRYHSILPWWTWPNMRVAFARLLPFLTWVLDYALWPNTIWLMHLHSLLWYGIACLLAGLFFRRFCSDPSLALLMALLYSVDDMHALPIGWISNRGGLIATCFACLALLAHHRWRRQGSILAACLAPLCVLLTVLSSELGVCTLAFIVAYAFSFDRAGLRARIASVLPSLLVVGIWRIVYTALGYGSVASGFYIDPVRQPLVFLLEWPQRHATYFAFQFGLSRWLLFSSFEFVGKQLPYLIPLIIGGGVVWLIVKRVSRDVEIRFWTIAFALGPIPLASAMPTDQTMMIAGLAGSALVAHLIASICRSWPAISGWRRITAGVVVGLAISINLIVSPVALARGTYLVGRTYVYLGFLPATVLGYDDNYKNEQLVIINGPDAVHALMIQHRRRVLAMPVFRNAWLLGSGEQDVEVKRIDEHTLQLSARGGYLADTLAAHFRGPGHPFVSGETIRLEALTVTLVEITIDGRPLVVRFRFDAPLTDQRFHYLAWDGDDYVLFDLPEVGGTVYLPEGRYSSKPRNR
ncbi:MAG: hypothetical protein JXA30_15370 [Deltaproteobacteria bacterium]|nr:hypothetical protein [Deltaproteobacteria bacterium]